MKKKLLAGCFIGLFVVGLIGKAKATIIDFNGATTGDYTHYEEDGYQIDYLVNSLHIADFTDVTGNVGYLFRESSIQLTAINGSQFHLSSILFPVSNSIAVGTIISNKGGSLNINATSFPTTFSFSGNLWSNLDWLSITRANAGSFFNFDNITLEPVPEPATMFLLGTGLVGVAGAAKRRKKKNRS